MTTLNSLKKLEKFLEKELTPRDESLKDAFREIRRYLEFLMEINRRAELAQPELISLQDDLMAAVKNGVVESFEQIKLNRYNHLSLVVPLEIESFYLFSKIYLDITVQFLGVRFSQLQGFNFKSFGDLFRSHQQIWKHPDVFVIKEEFRDVIQKLFPEIIDFRNDNVVHPKHSKQKMIGRRTHGFTLTPDRCRAQLIGLIRNSPQYDAYNSTDTRILWQLIEEYTNLFVEFSIQNLEKVRREMIAVK
jgi:hypothetical protein